MPRSKVNRKLILQYPYPDRECQSLRMLGFRCPACEAQIEKKILAERAAKRKQG